MNNVVFYDVWTNGRCLVFHFIFSFTKKKKTGGGGKKEWNKMGGEVKANRIGKKYS